MQQKSLFDYTTPSKKQAEEAKIQAALTEIAETAPKLKERHRFPPLAPSNLPPSFFVSATYDGRQRKALIKLYEPTSGRIYFWHDNTGHKPYCLTNLSPIELEKIPVLQSTQVWTILSWKKNSTLSISRKSKSQKSSLTILLQSAANHKAQSGKSSPKTSQRPKLWRMQKKPKSGRPE